MRPFAHTRARPPRMTLPEDAAFAQRHLKSVLAEARASMPANRERVELPLPYLVFQCAATLLALVQLAGGTATALDCACWPAAGAAACKADALRGVGCGLLGAAVLRGTEAWRMDATTDDTPYDREPVAAHAVLVASSPVALVASIVTGDATVGERAIGVALDAPSPLAGALLHAAGTAASCAWVQGVVQQGASQGLTQLAVSTAVRTLPAEPDATWWWPVVASGTALAPLIAALLAAGLATLTDGAVARSLRPTAAAEARAAESAVAQG